MPDLRRPYQRPSYYMKQAPRRYRSRVGVKGWVWIGILVAAALSVMFRSMGGPQRDADGAATKPAALLGKSVYYRNCDAARTAGVAPLNAGEPGYRGGLDADGDGVACEPYYGQ